MYLTKLGLIADHRLVMAGFPAVSSSTPRSDWKILFRHDGSSTLIQSIIPPDYSRIVAPELISQRKYTISIVEGTEYRFRMAVNAIARQPRTGRDLPCELSTWLANRCIGAHFTAMSATHDPLTEVTGKRRVHVNRYSIDGFLVAENADRLLGVVSDGIGRGRAWGCGLISLVPIG
jgi:CRISPR system Cascade subunit CasE